MSNFNSRGFPYHRGRRLRSSSNLRDIVSQVELSLDDLVMPYFIKEIKEADLPQDTEIDDLKAYTAADLGLKEENTNV